jgi:hypothetical protein
LRVAALLVLGGLGDGRLEVLLGRVERDALRLDLLDEAVRELGARDVSARDDEVLAMRFQQRGGLLLGAGAFLGALEAVIAGVDDRHGVSAT